MWKESDRLPVGELVRAGQSSSSITYVADRPASDCSRQLVPFHTKRFLHTADEGTVDIALPLREHQYHVPTAEPTLITWSCCLSSARSRTLGERTYKVLEKVPKAHECQQHRIELEEYSLLLGIATLGARVAQQVLRQTSATSQGSGGEGRGTERVPGGERNSLKTSEMGRAMGWSRGEPGSMLWRLNWVILANPGMACRRQRKARCAQLTKPRARESSILGPSPLNSDARKQLHCAIKLSFGASRQSLVPETAKKEEISQYSDAQNMMSLLIIS